MIRVEDLSQSFGKAEVLKNINFQIEDGEILAIMGSSGGGKTTLLRCMAGLLNPTKGKVYIGDIPVSKDPELARRKMGMVFQSAALFDYLDVQQNVLFGVRRHLKLNKSQEQDLLKDSLSRVNLIGSEHLLPAELSGGMRKRVGIARAIALSPEVLLYDEPTTGLDPITTYQIDEVISDMRMKLHVTSVIVSHDLTSVQRIADRVAFLHKGEMIFIGTPADFIKSDHPAIEELVTKSQTTHLL